MSIKNILIKVSIIFLIFGCMSIKQQNNLPEWVIRPYIEGYITGVGVAPPNGGSDISLQRSEAMAIAKDEIAKTIETEIDSFFTRSVMDKKVKDREIFTRDVKEKIINRAKNQIRGARVKETWIDSKGKLYILMVLNSNRVISGIEKEYKITEQELDELKKDLENHP